MDSFRSSFPDPRCRGDAGRRLPGDISAQYDRLLRCTLKLLYRLEAHSRREGADEESSEDEVDTKEMDSKAGEKEEETAQTFGGSVKESDHDEGEDDDDNDDDDDDDDDEEEEEEEEEEELSVLGDSAEGEVLREVLNLSGCSYPSTTTADHSASPCSKSICTCFASPRSACAWPGCCHSFSARRYKTAHAGLGPMVCRWLY